MVDGTTQYHGRIKHGDPRRPVKSNILIYHLLQRLCIECGATFNNQTIRTIAFVDDLVLLAVSTTGLQDLADDETVFVSGCGIAARTWALSSATVGRLACGKNLANFDIDSLSVRGPR